MGFDQEQLETEMAVLRGVAQALKADLEANQTVIEQLTIVTDDDITAMYKAFCASPSYWRDKMKAAAMELLKRKGVIY